MELKFSGGGGTYLSYVGFCLAKKSWETKVGEEIDLMGVFEWREVRHVQQSLPSRTRVAYLLSSTKAA